METTALSLGHTYGASALRRPHFLPYHINWAPGMSQMSQLHSSISWDQSSWYSRLGLVCSTQIRAFSSILPILRHTIFRMEAAKRLQNLLVRNRKIIGARCLHVTPQSMAKSGAMPSPKVLRSKNMQPVKATRAPGQSSRPNVQFQPSRDLNARIERSLPPLVMVDAARKSGAIDLDADTVYDFLRQFQLTMKKGVPMLGWEKNLCEGLFCQLGWFSSWLGANWI